MCCLPALFAEGSKDLAEYPGYRLFYWASKNQQLKVYANSGEFINVGSSHLGIEGGYIEVYDPQGILRATFNDPTNGVAVINDRTQEMDGPTGGGTTSGVGYIPGIVEVTSDNEGVWTIIMSYSNPRESDFPNVLNSDFWTRDDNQPSGSRVILAWDVSVSKDAAGNEDGSLTTGRLYSNDFNSIVNRNGHTTSPTFHLLTRDGYKYLIEMTDLDPWGFPLFSNSTGLTDNTGTSIYASAYESEIIKSADPGNFIPGAIYLYQPQAEDFNSFINNKIFFNSPDVELPDKATTTDIFRSNTHETWLLSDLDLEEPEFTGIQVESSAAGAEDCVSGILIADNGALILFESNSTGTLECALDLNNNGTFNDPEDVTLYKFVTVGPDTIVWDGKNGLGNYLELGSHQINVKLLLRGGEVHILMSDVENNLGGVKFTRVNGTDAPANEFYYDHRPVGGNISGSTDTPLPTTSAHTYNNEWGNAKMLDYWSFVDYEGFDLAALTLQIVDKCGIEYPDTDGDGKVDIVDIDDDNDGIPDYLEVCPVELDYSCSPGGTDPSADNDQDGILNYLDYNDPSVGNNCQDLNSDGICDVMMAMYDTDRDGIPDFQDLDSDNDGISDLIESGHTAPDLDKNGVIDGDPSFFGDNGFYNALATHPHDLNATANYVVIDWDEDLIPDHDDVDADNDGIHDLVEAGHAFSDGPENDGHIDPVVLGNPASSNSWLNPVDTDMDGVPDYHDLDTDNDGINDVAEMVFSDSDDDGIIGSGLPIQVDNAGRAVF